VRICLIYDCLYPWTIGGAERWLRSVAEALAAAGHEVTFLTRLQWPENDPPRIPGVEVIAVSPAEPLYGPDGKRTIGEPLRFGWGVLRHLARSGRKYDVVHASSFPFFSLPAVAAMRRRGGYAIVADWYEVWSRDYWLTYLGSLRGRVGLAIQRACARIPHQAFCFSQLHARRLIEIGYRGTPTVFRLGYTGPLQRPEPVAAEPLIVFAGRLIPEKRATAVVHAVMRAAVRIPQLRAVIFGDGPEKPAVDEAIAAYQAGGRVRAPGFVAASEVQETLRRALCLLLPSSREGYGMIVLEAAAAGVPSIVAASPDNAAVELVEEGVNGFIAKSSDPEELARAILAVHEAGPMLRDSTTSWFTRHAHDLSLDTALRQVVASYASERARGD
jgi:glycosyltransferase involved in cell wall biosynthesis